MDKSVLGIIGASVLIFAGVMFLNAGRPENQAAVGDEVAIMGAEHIDVGAPHEAYNSNPPTSGPHYLEPAAWGVKTEELPDEQVVHNLEHGGVWVTYQPDKVDQAMIDRLAELVNVYRSKTILTPRKANDTAIAVVSWGRIMKLDSLDETKISDFLRLNRNRGPEKIPD